MVGGGAGRVSPFGRVNRDTAKRPETRDVIEALVNGIRTPGGARLVALVGPPGSGRTTVASQVCADRRIRRHFGRVVRVALGPRCRSPLDVSMKVQEAVRQVTGQWLPRDRWADQPLQAPEATAELREAVKESGLSPLLVIDDVCAPGQLEAFLFERARCAWLVISSSAGLVPFRAVSFAVERMDSGSAAAMLSREVNGVSGAAAERLIECCGGSALALRLANRWIAADPSRGAAQDRALRLVPILEREADRFAGRPVVGHTVGGEPVDRVPADRTPDNQAPAYEVSTVRDNADRTPEDQVPADPGGADRLAVVVRAVLGTLPPELATRFRELCVFAPDEPIPVHVVARLWGATAGLDEDTSRQLCRDMARFGLIEFVPGSTPASRSGDDHVAIHPTVHAAAQAEPSAPDTRPLAALLVESAEADLPPVDEQAEPGETIGPDALPAPRKAWWRLDGERDQYLFEHAVRLLTEAGRVERALALASDLRWIAARARRGGPLAPAADLAGIGGGDATGRAIDLIRVARLLRDADPEPVVLDTLCSRLEPWAAWRAQVERQNLLPSASPRLLNAWTPPDLPAPPSRPVPRPEDGHRPRAVSDDGRWLAEESHGEVVIRSLEAGGRTVTLPGAQQPAAKADDAGTGALGGRGPQGPALAVLALSPNGALVAAGYADGTVRMWDRATGRDAPAPPRHTGAVRAAAFSDDGSYLATAGANGVIRVCDTAAGAVVETFESGAIAAADLIAVAVAPEGVRLATATQQGVRITDLTGNQSVGRLVSRSCAAALALSPDGSRLAVCDEGRVRLWDLAEPGRPFRRAKPSDAPADTIPTEADSHSQPVNVTAGGAMLAVSHWHGLEIRDAAALRPTVRPIRHPRASCVALSPDGGWLATAAENSVRVWNLATGRAIDVPCPYQFTPQGKNAAVSYGGAWIVLPVGHDGSVAVCARATGRTTVLHTGSPIWASTAISPAGTLLAATDRDGVPRLFDPRSGHPTSTLAGTRHVVTALVFSPLGNWIAAATRDHTVHIWTPDGRPIAKLDTYSSPPLAMAVSPDARRLAVADQDGKVHILDVAAQRRVALVYSEPGAHPSDLAYSPDGAWLALVGGHRLVVRDAQSGRQVAAVRTAAPLQSVAWGERIFVGGKLGVHGFDFAPALQS